MCGSGRFYRCFQMYYTPSPQCHFPPSASLAIATQLLTYHSSHISPQHDEDTTRFLLEELRELHPVSLTDLTSDQVGIARRSQAGALKNIVEVRGGG